MHKQFYLGLTLGASVGIALTLMLTLTQSPEAKHTALTLTEESTKTQLSAHDKANRVAQTKPSDVHDQTSLGIRKTPSTERHSEAEFSLDCASECAQHALDQLLSASQLSAETVERLANNSHVVAELLAQDQPRFDDFLIVLTQMTERDVRKANLRIAYHLPGSMANAVLHELDSGSQQSRVDAVELLTMLTASDSAREKELAQSINTESDPVVLAATIRALTVLGRDMVDETTLSAVSNHLLYHNEPAVRGQALEALTHWQYVDNNFQTYLEQGLTSHSAPLQRSSLQSLSNLLNTQQITSGDSFFQSMQRQITTLANNPDAPADVRIQALSLMSIHLKSQI